MAEWNALECFEKEANILKSMNHPFIPKYIDDFEEEHESGKIYVLVQLYIKGNNLEDLILTGKRFTLDEVLNVFIKLLDILNYIHSLLPPVIHQDIHPKNIILDKKGNVYLIDFNAIGNNSSTAEIFVGTPGYSANELYDGKVLYESDIYSLGMTIIFLLTGKNPNDIPLKEGRLSYRNFVELPEYLVLLLDKMIDPNAELRLKSANEILKILKKHYAPKEMVHHNRNEHQQKEKPSLDDDIDLKSRDEMGLTPLMVEVKHNRYDTARLMVNRGADINAKDNDGLSVLSYAVKNSNKKILKLLFQHRVTLNSKDNTGANVLIQAVKSGSDDMVKLLIRKGIPLDDKDDSGKTALNYAVMGDNQPIIKFLIESGAGLDGVDMDSIKGVIAGKDEELNKQDNQGKTALMQAIFDYEDDKARVLITKGADLNIKDKKGKAAIIYTIIHERFDIAQLLIEKGADVNTVDNKGMTALMWAAERSVYKIAGWLVENGADVHAKDKQGNPVSSFASTKKVKNILKKAGVRF